MAKFKVVYKSGVTQEVEQSDCHTVEQFINCRFGANHQEDILPEVTMVTEEEAQKPVKVVTKPATAAAVKPASKK